MRVCMGVDSWLFTYFLTPRAPSIRSFTASCRTTSAVPFVLCGIGCVTSVAAEVDWAVSAADIPPTGTSSRWRRKDALRGPRP